MSKDYIFQSQRLGFRLWEESDLTPFAELGSDVEGLRFFARPYTLEESYEKMCDHIVFLEEHGYGFWAVDSLEDSRFIGTIGFNHPSIRAFFTPCLQIGWCLNKKYWGQGLATEGALASIEYLKTHSDIEEIFSYTSVDNVVSQRVMQKIGMEFVDNFTIDQEYTVYKKTL